MRTARVSEILESMERIHEDLNHLSTVTELCPSILAMHYFSILGLLFEGARKIWRD